jgi:hypothetical protein
MRPHLGVRTRSRHNSGSGRTHGAFVKHPPVGVNEMAMRLRETTSAIAGALELLKDQGRAEETSVRGRWRLHVTAHCDRPIREAESKRI